MTRESRIETWEAAWRRCARRWEGLSSALGQATGWKIWNPGRYGERWHARFTRRYPPGRRPLVLFGLNPGPYGMAQSGIPFTDLRRLAGTLPGLARELRESGERVEVPGLAPADLRPFLGRSFESSSVRIYRLLEEGWGSAERGWRDVVVANPCTLLFMDPAAGKNRTPADLRAAVLSGGGDSAAARLLQERCDRVRIRCALDAVEALGPRGAVLLGKDVQKALGPALVGRMGERAVVPWEHPARAVPAKWSAGLISLLRRRGLSRRDLPSKRGRRK